MQQNALPRPGCPVQSSQTRPGRLCDAWSHASSHPTTNKPIIINLFYRVDCTFYHRSHPCCRFGLPYIEFLTHPGIYGPSLSLKGIIMEWTPMMFVFRNILCARSRCPDKMMSTRVVRSTSNRYPALLMKNTGRLYMPTWACLLLYATQRTIAGQGHPMRNVRKKKTKPSSHSEHVSLLQRKRVQFIQRTCRRAKHTWDAYMLALARTASSGNSGIGKQPQRLSLARTCAYGGIAMTISFRA